MDDHLTIGEFARRCGLSRSALRFYDDCGLLPPTAVDEASGYRYYAASQVARGELIRQLRAADMPVEGVRRFLAADHAKQIALLQVHADALQEHLGKVQQAVEMLRIGLSSASGRQPQPGCVLGGRVLAEAIGQVLFAAATASQREELTGVLLETKEDSLRVVATDSYRLAVRDVIPDSLTASSLRALVPATALAELLPTLAAGGPCLLQQRLDGDVEVVLDGRHVSLQVLDAAFPDYEQILVSSSAAHHGLVGRRDLATVFETIKTKQATISFRPDELQIRAAAQRASVAVHWEGPEMDVTVNPVFIAEALACHVGPDVAIEAIDALRPITFRSADSGTLNVLVMPIRVDGSANAS